MEQIQDDSVRPAYVYALIDPSNGEIFYIGCTVNPATRLSLHISNSKTYQISYNRKERRIREILAKGLKPELKILEETTVKDQRDREHYWLQKYIADGGDITNSVPVILDIPYLELLDKYNYTKRIHAELVKAVDRLAEAVEGRQPQDYKERLFFLKELLMRYKK